MEEEPKLPDATTSEETTSSASFGGKFKHKLQLTNGSPALLTGGRSQKMRLKMNIKLNIIYFLVFKCSDSLASLRVILG